MQHQTTAFHCQQSIQLMTLMTHCHRPHLLCPHHLSHPVQASSVQHDYSVLLQSAAETVIYARELNINTPHSLTQQYTMLTHTTAHHSHSHNWTPHSVTQVQTTLTYITIHHTHSHNCTPHSLTQLHTTLTHNCTPPLTHTTAHHTHLHNYTPPLTHTTVHHTHITAYHTNSHNCTRRSVTQVHTTLTHTSAHYTHSHNWTPHSLT